MRHYEMMVILKGDLEDDVCHAYVGKIASRVADLGGSVLHTDEWGRRELATKLERLTHGYYVVFDVEIEPPQLTELERLLKIADEVLRFKAIRPDVRVRAG